MASIAEQVFSWLEQYPYIIWTLKNGLINYSSLTRKIQKDLKIKNFDAVLIAIRRYKGSIKRVEEEMILGVLKQSTLEIRTGINVYITKNVDKITLNKLEHFHLIKGSDADILICNKEVNVPYIKKHENTVEVRIKSPAAIEATKGFIAFVYGIISERGINIIETYSAYTDTIFIIEKKDLAAIVETLGKIGIK
ncbi:MAG: hypothetical protein ABIB71_00790 [Candidatus Woesearchaeota archaeon]